ncbi:uncharacterized protein MELLADRAFT_105984 [Melampsora larici-populina 98AG31]|uniref:Uncharacterized protein n=1 Tax=Melampsora larici-populina (strain 98AG31 / pathotype 3-4-7) TaxID=747676 RepID=F4RJZ5_MELLP|nr:uncharacterized protein MELLADRAFT_105984 [Melampsora larici-populina 98AG31]EGG07411.1 hypothetical protein MELLADRAFT_105984 [Melampsora larici-populina 98AG31]
MEYDTKDIHITILGCSTTDNLTLFIEVSRNLRTARTITKTGRDPLSRLEGNPQGLRTRKGPAIRTEIQGSEINLRTRFELKILHDIGQLEDQCSACGALRWRVKRRGG